MLIKIINFSRKSPRKSRDLRRLIRYLLTPKLSQTSHRTPPRLLGPPVLRHLLLNSKPWGVGVDESADDITNQLLRYCRYACEGRSIPDVWYVHIILSFAPAATPTLRRPTDAHTSPPKKLSIAQSAIRIAEDALDALGWSKHQPAFLCVHGDRSHIHVHAVIATPFVVPIEWDILRLSRVDINELAKACADTFQLPLAKPRKLLKTKNNLKDTTSSAQGP
jgi:hypothetical protein